MMTSRPSSSRIIPVTHTTEQRVTRGRKFLRVVQLFPGYIFVKSVGNLWRELLTATGVTGIIRDEDGPLTVSDEVVEQLRRDDRVPTGVGPVARFRPGQAVFLLAGSFVDKVVIFDGMRGDERCAVLLQLLGRQTRMIVDESSLTEII